MPVINFLAGIIEDKRRRLARSLAERPLEVVRAEAYAARRDARAHALRAALERRGSVNIIAEIKRASPSKGLIRERVAPRELARAYEAGGASAISVLTEEDHFRGSLEDLREVRAAVALPLLRKDFIFDEYQVYEAAAAGADALLLIVAALDAGTLARLRRLAEDELQLDALIEVHTIEEMRGAESCGARIVGVNNRDLRTFDVSLNVSVELARHAPAGALLVSESGISAASDIRRLCAQGFRGFLVGETLMRSDSPADALRALTDETREEDDAG
ncbi:MAG TPA: indole-3-glycerol phosphate synthase TrpC [Pyrinomonadaceae bacterium]|nr:indole-3-glycerol phosphate synthase TrpC [Pyrinomonadaceae bacterium]